MKKCSSEELRELLLWLRDSEHDEELSAEAFSRLEFDGKE